MLVWWFYQYLWLCTHKRTVLLQIWTSVVLSVLMIMHTQKYSSASDLSFCGSINTYDYAHTNVQFCFRFELLRFYQYLWLCTHKSTDLSFLGCSCVAFYQWRQRKVALWCNVRSCHTRLRHCRLHQNGCSLPYFYDILDATFFKVSILDSKSIGKLTQVFLFVFTNPLIGPVLFLGIPFNFHATPSSAVLWHHRNIHVYIMCVWS